MVIFSRLFILIIAFCFVFNNGFPALAEDGEKYGNWQSSDDRLDKLINELDLIIDEGTKSRAAHPGFLQDLNSIIDRYRVPKKLVFFSDNFADNNFTENPTWNVKKGSFRINRYGSLYSAIAASKPSPAEETEAESDTDRNLRILFGVINELAKDKNADQEPENEIDTQAIISSEAAIANSFILDFSFRSNSEWGSTSIGLVQGDDPQSGYHLVYQASPAENRPMQLIKYRNGKPYVIEEIFDNSPDLDDDIEHKIRFIRKANGKMVVKVDNIELMRATDLSYQDDFTGVMIVNNGGSYSYDNIEIFIKKRL
ncbi:MAG: hypothetical protein JRF02_04445 [Deltaproteobacteria bacterium]|jgi:hypothetical protein|nr:hypothetical protein [Deltaproteobacteria bacterium]